MKSYSLKGIQQPSKEKGNLNSAGCMHEERPMSVHIKRFMQLCGAKSFVHNVIAKASVLHLASGTSLFKHIYM